MNLLQSLAGVYDEQSSWAGVEREGEDTVLLPLFHTYLAAHITLTIDIRGNFVDAQGLEFKTENVCTIVPSTVDSASRSGPEPPPNALNDKLIYMIPNPDQYIQDDRLAETVQKRSGAYAQQLAAWADSSYAVPQLCAVRNYLDRKRIISHLAAKGILTLDEAGFIDLTKKGLDRDILSCVVRFRVLDPHGGDGYVAETWKNRELFQSWISYYTERMLDKGKNDVCYVTGEYTLCTNKHANGLRSSSDWAKLISSNENGNIVFSRDWFRESSDAVAVGLLTSYKAHSALSWLIARQGRALGSNIRVHWDSKGDPLEMDFFADTPHLLKKHEYRLFDSEAAYQAYIDELFADYLMEKKVYCMLVLDTANKQNQKGRLAILDFKAIPANLIYKRLKLWHQTACWQFSTGKRMFTGAPSLFDVVIAAYGIEYEGRLSVANEAMFARQVNRVFSSILLDRPIPPDIRDHLIKRAGESYRYRERHNWLMVQQVACAVLNRDIIKGKIMLDKENMDRDYLMGRLLAVADYMEQMFFYECREGRRTHGCRYMQMFSRMPGTYWKIIYKKLAPYLGKIMMQKSGPYVCGMMNEIVGMLSWEDFSDLPLGAGYLLGYSSQRASLRQYEHAARMMNK